MQLAKFLVTNNILLLFYSSQMTYVDISNTIRFATYICNICVVRIVSNISKSYLFMSKRRTTTLSQAYRCSLVIYGQLN